jgi:hypothetical protein
MVKSIGSRRFRRRQWTLNQWVRLVAGGVVLLSLLLATLVNPYWLLLTAFVGLNLVQSAFTNWCPLITLLRRLGVPEE